MHRALREVDAVALMEFDAFAGHLHLNAAADYHEALIRIVRGKGLVSAGLWPQRDLHDLELWGQAALDVGLGGKEFVIDINIGEERLHSLVPPRHILCIVIRKHDVHGDIQRFCDAPQCGKRGIYHAALDLR